MAHNNGYNNHYPPQNVVYNSPNRPPNAMIPQMPVNQPPPHGYANPNYYPPQNVPYQPSPQPVQPPPQPVQPPPQLQPPPVQPHMGMLIKQPSGRSLGNPRSRGNSFRQPALPHGPPPSMNQNSSSRLHREPSKPRLPPGPPPNENYQQPLTRQKSRPVMPPPGPPPDENYHERQSRLTRKPSGRLNPTLPPGPPPSSPRARSSSRPNIGDIRSQSQGNFGSRRRKGSFEAMPVMDSGRFGNSSKNVRKVGSSTRTARNLGSNRSAASKNSRSTRKGKNKKTKKKPKPKKSKAKPIRKTKNKKGKGKKKNKGRGRSFSEIDCDNIDFDLRNNDRMASSRQVTYNSFTEEDAGKKEAWSVQWSEDYQKPYYFNKYTGESLWEPPGEIMY